jgi:hypothetical protein
MSVELRAPLARRERCLWRRSGGMHRAFEGLLDAALDAAVASGALTVAERPAADWSRRSTRSSGTTTRFAHAIAKRSGRAAPDVAAALIRHLDDPQGWIEHAEAAGPGFVNVRASLAFWRAALARVLGAEPGPRAARGRAFVVDSAGVPRSALAADTVARLLDTVGWDVARVAVPSRASPERTSPARFDRLVVLHGADDRRAARLAKDRATRPGHVMPRGQSTCHPAPRRRSRRRGGQRLARPRALRWPGAGRAPALRRRRLALDRIGGPRRVRHALADRAARAGGRTYRLDALGEDDRACLREVGGLDVLDAATARLGPAVAAHARALAAAFNRHYNRGAFDASDATLAGARRALACGVGRGLEGALRLLDAAERG